MSVEYSRILAKSFPEVSVQQHVEDCLNISRQLQVCIPAIPLPDAEVFWKVLYIAVIMHDLGKAHAEFQALLRGWKNDWHWQRHELFSLIFVDGLQLSEKQKELVAFAVAGHHKQLNELAGFIQKNYISGETDSAWGDWDEEKTDFEQECRKIDTGAIAALLSAYGVDWRREQKKFDIGVEIRKLKRIRPVAEDDSFWEKVLLVGAVRQCDHLASAGIRKIGKLDLKDFDFLFSYSLYEHQQKAAGTVGNLILTAPTGAGKTETALLWLRKQLEAKGQGRVFYVLPYTASINAMYERLNRDFGAEERKVGMLHGKLSQYLEYRMAEEDSIPEDEEKRQLLEDFKSLVTPLKVVTPFQLLKSLFGLKGFEKGMFEWCGCYLIFDEIHAYDSRVFAQIIVLLKFMGQYMKASVHIMTATLPRFMRRELEKVVGSYTEISASPDLYEQFGRHRVEVRAGRLENSLEEVQQRLEQGQKVLVVCNTIAMAQQVYQVLQSEHKVLLHGAFTGRDRYCHERELQHQRVDLLVGTQAIEVSLDIDYDCIYTEPAPLDALIQRFGRVNRKRTKGICDCIVFEERNEVDRFIYRNEQVIVRTLEILRNMAGKDNGIVHEVFWQEAMDYVYPDWEEREEEDYKQTLRLLEYTVLHELVPLDYSERREEEFKEQFAGVQVLPVVLRAEYQRFLENHQFVKAESLLVNLSEKRFASLKKEQQLEKERFVFGTEELGKLQDKTMYLIKRKYTEELGLLINEEETQVEEACFL